MNKLAWLLATPLLISNVMAADLMQVYRDAIENDPSFAAARSTLDAGREKMPQARAGLLPSLTLSGNTVWNENDIKTGLSPNTLSSNFNSNGYNVSLSQPLFRWQNWVAYDQSKIQVALAEANFTQARQDLILRVAQAYFDVIYATENLTAVRANKAAIAQQLASAQKNFEVGTATITDTHEAQARFDLATAQEIAAESDLEIRQRTLQSIVGKEPGVLAPPRKDANLNPPQPADMKQWVEAAEQGSITVQVQQANADIADREVSRQRGGHYPSLNLLLNHSQRDAGSTLFGGGSNVETTDVTLRLTIPLYEGGLTTASTQEAVYRQQKAREDFEQERRAVERAVRAYFSGVSGGVELVQALSQSVTAQQSALQAKEEGFKSGLFTLLPVLDAQRDLFLAKRDYAQARYDYLLYRLRLKQAVGTLSDADLTAIYAALE